MNGARLSSGSSKRIGSLLATLLAASMTRADEVPSLAERIEVTATRVPEPVDNVPASLSIVTGDELRARGAHDLRTALALFAGVEGSPNGDAGPAGAVPSLWGLREADAYLLVVDGVPWGGAFNPSTPSIDMNGIERIEVLRGAAPVMFGATSFVGVIHLIHYAAGRTPSSVAVSGGQYGTRGVSLTTGLPTVADYTQSLILTLEQQGFAEDRTGFRRTHALYRGLADVGSTHLHLDADLSVVPQDPSGNTLLLDGTHLHPELSANSNFNPAGARLNQKRYHVAASLDGSGSAGDWVTTLAFTRTRDDILRGMLRGNAFLVPPDAGVGDGFQADGFTQRRSLTDIYFDAHVTTALGSDVNLTYGLDHLHGDGREDAINFGYCVDATGVEQPCNGAHHADEIVHSTDRRDFSGAYAQADIRATPTLDLLLGMRLNRTREGAAGLAIDNTGPTPLVSFDATDGRTTTRISGLAGGSWRLWTQGRDSGTLYADWRNSFKPLAIDFGPEAEVKVLRPETANSLEAGVKAQWWSGRLDLDASVFDMDFRNGLTYAPDAAGNMVRTNAARSRFQGLEVESTAALVPDLRISAHYALHDARFRAYRLADGTDVSGHHVEMSPTQTAGIGLLFGKPSGITASVVMSHVGARYLDKANAVRVGGYITLDTTVGYGFGRYRAQLSAYNLTDRRDPTSLSDLQGSVTVTQTAGYYRLPGRMAMITVSADF